MLRIAVCDDEENIVKQIESFVVEYAKTKDLDIRLNCYTNPFELLAKSNSYELIFLDIDMPEANGIEIGKKIKEKSSKIGIIYVTSYSDYACQSFAVRPFGYVLKPFSRDKIEKELNDFFVDFNQSNIKHGVKFKGKHSDLLFNPDDIYYFEVVGKNIIEITSNDKKETVYCSLMEVFDKVKNYSYAIPHQSYIVNLNYVNTIVKLEITMQNGSKIPIAQKRSKSFRVQHSEFLQNTFTAI